MGKSSGGFGALHLVMQRPGVFQACASISGDCAFEYVYASEFLACLRGLVPFDMDPGRFLEEFERTHELSGDGHAVINILAMAACYSPNADSPLGFDLPIDLHTGERIDAVWRKWLDFDPLERVDASAEALKQLDLLHLECGIKDEFHLQWGLRRLCQSLERADVPHEHEEHGGGHRGIDHRFEPVLRKMTRALGST
jgi:enterochelin esterase family protein